MATPRSVQEARDEAKKKRKAQEKQQTTLDKVVQKIETPTSFLSKGILREVTRHVVVNDQAGLPFQVTVTRRTELYSRRCSLRAL